MRFCELRGKRVQVHKCREAAHPGCYENKRVGYCQYAEAYRACAHEECRSRQAENLSKLISGRSMITAEGRLIDLGRKSKAPRPKIGRNNVKVEVFRTHRFAKSGQLDGRRSWREWQKLSEYMEAGRIG